MRIPRKSGSVKNKLQRIAVHAELVNADNPSRAHHALLRDMPGVQPLERVMGIEPTRPAWKAGALAIVLYPQIPSETNRQPRYNSIQI